MERLMDDNTRDQVREYFGALNSPVTLLVYTQESTEDNPNLSNETRQLAEEVADLSEHITVEVLDIAQVNGVYADRAPAIAVLGEDKTDYGIRFYGIPSGYEFMSLLESIKLVSTGDHDLDESTLAYLNDLDETVHMQVFVTPTCPYCPNAVTLAHRMALASDKVRADMVEANEFPELSMKYNVMGVPRTVINEEAFIEGAAPEQMVLGKVREALAN